MPDLATRLGTSFAQALDIAEMAERIRMHPAAGIHVRSELRIPRVNLIYEMAYLRAFNRWEVFLEEVLLRCMCGYSFQGQVEVPVAAYQPNVSSARAYLYGGRAYLLWHDPVQAMTRANNNLQNSHYSAVLHPSVLLLRQFADVRNRIAHDQDDAKAKFDATTMTLLGRHFPGSRPGTFLREWTNFGGVPIRWLGRICGELSGLASQFAP